MTTPKPPKLRIVGTGEKATVIVNHRTWSNYLVYISEKPKPTAFGSLMVEPYGKANDFEIILIPSADTKLISRPIKPIKKPQKRGRKPKNDLRQWAEN